MVMTRSVPSGTASFTDNSMIRSSGRALPGFGAVGCFGSLAGGHQILHGPLLLALGALKGRCKAVDVVHQMPDLVFIGNVQTGVQFALAELRDGVPHSLHRVGQYLGQTDGQHQSCCQYQCGKGEGFKQYALLALDEGCVAEADLYLTQVALLFVLIRRRGIKQEQVVLQRDALAHDIGDKYLQLCLLAVVAVEFEQLLA